MSDDLIRRSDAIKALNREKSDWNCDYNVPIDNCIKRLKKVKSADRLQGYWIKTDVATYRCSECGKIQIADDVNELNFCCCCGSHNKVRRKGADDGADSI